MRAWLLLFAVLATFQPIVQVASTEDISSTFIQAISPQKKIENDFTQQKKKNIKELAISTGISINSSTSSSLSSSPKSLINYFNTQEIKEKSSTSKSFMNKNINLEKYTHNNEIKNYFVAVENMEKVLKNEIEKVQMNNTKINQLENKENFKNTNMQNKVLAKNNKSSKEMTVVENKKTETNSQYPNLIQQKYDHENVLSNYQNYKEENVISKAVQFPKTSNSVLPFDEYGIIDGSNIFNDIIEQDEPATYSNKEILNERIKPDPSTLVEIENSLLSIFNMKRPPKIDRSKIIIPEAMKKLYAQITGHELDSVNIPKPGLLTKSANTVRSFTHKDSKIDDRFPHHHRFRLFFDIQSIPANEKLKAAELQLARDIISHTTLNPRQANRTRYQVLVYDITRVGIRGKREPTYLLLDNKTVRLNNTDTVSLDVHPAVDRWLASPKKNYGLLVEVRTMRSLKPAPHHHVRLRRSADEPHNDWQYKQPLLFTYTDDERHRSRSIRDVTSRSKRAGNNRRRRKHTENCRRHSLYVDFVDVGWSDWIVAPPGYDAFYCHGKCPFPLPEHLNSTNHAVVQTLVNNIDPGKVPKACCVPTQLEGISMLYLNDQRTVVLKNYQDMTVVGCGCR